MHKVVIVGGGFGGLYAAKALAHAPVEVTLLSVIDRIELTGFATSLSVLRTNIPFPPAVPTMLPLISTLCEKLPSWLSKTEREIPVPPAVATTLSSIDTAWLAAPATSYRVCEKKIPVPALPNVLPSMSTLCERLPRCLSRREKKIPAATIEIAAMPPTTPPAMAPTFELLPFCTGEEVEDEAEPENEVGAGELRDPVAPAVVPVPEVPEEPGLPISEPGCTSGVPNKHR